MRKNIIIPALSVLSVISLLFGYTQNTEAERQRSIALTNMTKAVEAQAMADKNAAEAMRQEQIALAERKQAEKSLQECKGFKK